MGHREPPELTDLKSVHEAVVKLCRHVDGVGRDVQQIIKRLGLTKKSEENHRLRSYIFPGDGSADEVRASFKNITRLIYEAEENIEGMGYDINSIRSTLYSILEGVYTRDELIKMLLEDDEEL